MFVTLNQTKVCCRLAPDDAPQVGQTLELQFAPDKVLLFDAKTGERLLPGKPLACGGKVAQFKAG
ncbi:hypothetical protein D3C80_1325790 [compost metagenome]